MLNLGYFLYLTLINLFKKIRFYVSKTNLKQFEK